jgi:hypothetical protein
MLFDGKFLLVIFVNSVQSRAVERGGEPVIFTGAQD